MKICKIDNCASKAVGRGYCHKHYKRWQTHGDAEKVVNKRIHGMSLKERILDTIERVGECWIWKGSISNKGRPRLKVNCKTTTAHRASYIAFKGEIADGLYVCHTCDNPLCVNPEHLFLGTAKDNSQDCISKGRNCRGENHHNSKLNADAINDIESRNLSAKEYAKKYNVHYTTIYRVWSGKSWINRRIGNV